MLKRFSVSGYRNFEDEFVLDFSDIRDYRFNSNAIKNGLVKTMLIYGKNAVGKTNLGNALFDIRANIKESVVEVDQRSYLNADNESGKAHFRYDFVFQDKDLSYEYTKSSLKEVLYEKLTIDDRVIMEARGEEGFTYCDILPDKSVDLNWEFFDPGMTLLNYISNNTPSDRLGIVADLHLFIQNMGHISDRWLNDRNFVENLVSTVIEANKVSELQTFLQQFGIKESLELAQTPAGDKVLYFKHKKLVPFVENCSSGTIALMRLFNHQVRVKKPSLLFIDEFDAFYHHDLAEAIVAYFREDRECQTIAATHNTDLFSNKVLRPDCLYILSKEKITTASNATDRELREGNNLEKLYKAGEFDV